jgi:hypothetical protein
MQQSLYTLQRVAAMLTGTALLTELHSLHNLVWGFWPVAFNLPALSNCIGVKPASRL